MGVHEELTFSCRSARITGYLTSSTATTVAAAAAATNLPCRIRIYGSV
jgi:hypothetical protein